MKIHTLVGAEILQRVAFPIGRAHRPRAPRALGRNGYPDGLKGEEIPPGARVLAPSIA